MENEKLELIPSSVLLQLIQAQIDAKKINHNLYALTKLFTRLSQKTLSAKGVRILISKGEKLVCKGEVGTPEGYLITAPFSSGIMEVYWSSQSESSGKLPLVNLLSQIFSSSVVSAIEYQVMEESIENSLNGFDIVNAKGELIYANKAYIKMWGFDNLEEVLKTNPADHCVDPEIPFKIISALKATGECFIEFLARRKDGSTFNVLMWARLAHAADGSEIYPTSSIDVTSMKKVENDLRESLRSRDEFLSVVSHELKTPLTTLKINSQTRTRNLDKGFNENFSLDKLRKIFSDDNRQIVRLTRLIDDMLDIARISTGKLQLQMESFNFCDMVADVVEQFHEQYRVKNVSLQFTCNEDIIGNWDRFRIEQVLSNLLTNALKYGKLKPVQVEATQDNDMVILRVKDEGIGIAKENQKRIFERFERAIPSSAISGLGLGLYITKQIVEMHRGSIELVSALDSGSVFTVRLPKN